MEEKDRVLMLNKMWHRIFRITLPLFAIFESNGKRNALEIIERLEFLNSDIVELN